MRYLWTEDTGAGCHFWQLANTHLFANRLIVESKGSNQGIVDAVRDLQPGEGDIYYIAFDQVFDNQDIRNKYLDLRDMTEKYPEQVILLDMICFEYIILCFRKLVEWTGTGKEDKIAIREDILSAVRQHRIEVSLITNPKTLTYLGCFKRYSTERVIKSLVNELTENDMWSVKGSLMGKCWYLDCCADEKFAKQKCNVGETTSGEKKIISLLYSNEMQRVTENIKK